MKVKVKLTSVPVTVQYRDGSSMVSFTQVGFECEGAEFEVEVEDGLSGIAKLMQTLADIATSALNKTLNEISL
jgi:hypothetical protein